MHLTDSSAIERQLYHDSIAFSELLFNFGSVYNCIEKLIKIPKKQIIKITGEKIKSTTSKTNKAHESINKNVIFSERTVRKLVKELILSTMLVDSFL